MRLALGELLCWAESGTWVVLQTSEVLTIVVRGHGSCGRYDP